MGVIAAVLVLIGTGVYFGWYVPVYQPLHETVAEVNGVKFDMAYLLDFSQYEYGQYASMFLDYGLSDIQNDELMRQEAGKLGFTVSESEIDQNLQGSADKNNHAMRDFVRAQLLAQKLRESYFKPQLPETADQRSVLAMFLESQSQTELIQQQVEAGTDFGLLAGELSLDTTTKDDKGDLGLHPKEVLPGITGSDVLTDAIFNQDVGSLSQIEDQAKQKQLGYWLVKVTERNSETNEAHAFGMLLDSQEEALMIKGRLNAGEDFDTLAEEYSQSWTEDNKDDLGWISIDSTAATTQYIFDTTVPLDTVSQPIKDASSTTKGGYWLFKVVSAENSAISDDDQNTIIGQLFTDWLDQILANPDNSVASYLDQNRKDWATDYLSNNA
jgi:parvulin-like peptidyl-prolyl isomerase